MEEWEQTAEDEGALRVCADDETVEGIDVSYWQEKIDWPAVATTSVKFAIVRVSYGAGFKDPRFEENWAGAKDAGLIRGAYQYFRPHQDPLEQAQLFIDALAADPLGPSDLPAVLDVEATDGLSNAAVRARMKTWLEAVEQATGKRPIIYTAAFMQNVVGGDFAGYPLWVANYTTKCPLLPSGWDEWSVWQYTESGKVAGINGNVDRNRFNGSYADLVAFAGGTAPEPPPATDPPADDADPAAPQNLLPADGSHVTTDAVTLRCDPMSGATSYEFSIDWYDQAKSTWKPYYTYTTSSSAKTFWPVLDAAFRFRVRAMTDGSWSPSSSTSTFAFGDASLP